MTAPLRSRGWPLLDLGLTIPIALGLAAVLRAERRRRRSADALLDRLRREVPF